MSNLSPLLNSLQTGELAGSFAEPSAHGEIHRPNSELIEALRVKFPIHQNRELLQGKQGIRV